MKDLPEILGKFDHITQGTGTGTGGITSRTYRVESAEGPLFIKGRLSRNMPFSLWREWRTLSFLQGVEELRQYCPAPRFFVSSEGWDWLGMSVLAGVGGDVHAPHPVSLCGAFLRRLHTAVPLKDEKTRRFNVQKRLGVGGANNWAILRTAFPDRTRKCFNHGDFRLRHIYFTGGKVSGVCDWGSALFTDPLWDVYSFLRPSTGISFSKEQVDAFLAAYGAANIFDHSQEETRLKALISAQNKLGNINLRSTRGDIERVLKEAGIA